jgi:hypothetical protein
VLLPIVLAIATVLPAPTPAAAFPHDGSDPFHDWPYCAFSDNPPNHPNPAAPGNRETTAASGGDYGDFAPYQWLGTIQLKWSTFCQTNWGEVYPEFAGSGAIDGGMGQAELYRPYDGAVTTDNAEGGNNSYYTYTPQLYGAGMTVCVNGGIYYSDYFTYNEFCA